MIRKKLAAASFATAMAIAGAVPAKAQAEADAGENCSRWVPADERAFTVTGPLTLCGGALNFENGPSLPLRFVEVSRGLFAEERMARGFVFALDPPGDPALLNGNSFCGREATYVVFTEPSRGAMSMTVYSAQSPRHFNDAPCAVYFYGPDEPARYSTD